MLTLIGIAIFLLAEYIFNYCAVGDSTNWSIYYFSSTYMAFIFISMDLVFKETSKSVRYTALSIVVFLAILLLMELSFINVPFDDYILNVNDNKLRVFDYGLLAIILIFITIMAWERRRLRR